MAIAATSPLSGRVKVNVSLDAREVAAPREVTNFILHVARDSVANYSRENNDLVIQFDDGKILRIRRFFEHGADYNNLVFEGDAASGGGDAWLADFTQAVGPGGDGVVDQLVTYELLSGEGEGLFGLVGLLAAGGGLIGLGATAGGGSSSQNADTTAPAAPTVTVADGDGDDRINAGGTAEPGSTVVTWPDGTGSTVTADSSGTWSVESPTAQTSGTVTVVASDAAGNASTPATASYADTTAPAAPTVTVADGDGGFLGHLVGGIADGADVRDGDGGGQRCGRQCQHAGDGELCRHGGAGGADADGRRRRWR